MGWRFEDYIDSHGRNATWEWLAKQDAGTRAHIVSLLHLLSSIDDWSHKKTKNLVKRLDGKHAGMTELRLTRERTRARPKQMFRLGGEPHPQGYRFVLCGGGLKDARGEFDPPDAFDKTYRRWQDHCAGEGTTSEHREA